MSLIDYQSIIDFFDKKSVNWHFSDADKQKALDFVNRINFSHPDQILDIGCGTGDLCHFLRAKYRQAQIVGLDISLEMLKKVSSDYDLILQGNAESIPLQDRSCDLVINYCVFPHFLNKQKVIAEIYRILKPAGYYYIIHPDGREKTDAIHRRQKSIISHQMLPEKQEIDKLLSNSGFKILNFIDNDILFYVAKK